MDLSHLRYAVEIARTRSISQAAENLYMGQPNLSRAIRDLEAELHIQIFRRTSHGVSITAEGEDFLLHAASIVAQADEIENIYKHAQRPKLKFSVCGPRAGYISRAFASFTRQVTEQHAADEPFEFFYKETNAMKAVNELLADNYSLAIVRYQTIFDKYFRELFVSKKLNAETIADFPMLITLRADDPRAQQDSLQLADLAGGIELQYADPYVPTLPAADILKRENEADVCRRIYVSERESVLSLLETLPDAFMWTSKMDAAFLNRYHLVQLPCKELPRTHKDILLYRKNYKLTDLDSQFIMELCRAKRDYLD